jgi:hypothetical protein
MIIVVQEIFMHVLQMLNRLSFFFEAVPLAKALP